MSGLFFFDLLDRLLNGSDEGGRIGQIPLGDLKLRHQHTVAINKDQAIPWFHSHSPHPDSARTTPSQEQRARPLNYAILRRNGLSDCGLRPWNIKEMPSDFRS